MIATIASVIVSVLMICVGLAIIWGGVETVKETIQYRRDWKRHKYFWWFLSALFLVMGIVMVTAGAFILSDPGQQDRRKDQCHALNGIYSNGQCWSEEIELEG